MRVHRSGTAARAASNVVFVSRPTRAPRTSSPAADLPLYRPCDLLAPSDVSVIGRRSEYVGVSELDLFDYEYELTLTPYLADPDRLGDLIILRCWG
jgi:hypothetical protein